MAIVKSNKLIESSYRLGSREQFFVLFLVSKLDSVNDEQFPNFTVHYSDIKKILNFDGKRRVANTDDVFKIMQNLNSSPIQFEDEEIREQSVWITRLRENKKNETFSFSFPPSLKPFLIQLKEQFTKYHIKNIVNLNSHAMRMYEILKRYEYEGQVVLEIEGQLKKWLGIQGKYPEYFEFKRCILLKTQKELKTYTDIAFTFEIARKEKRKTVALKFTITQNTPKKKAKALDKLQSITIESGNKTLSVKKQSPKTHKAKVATLSWARKKAYDFLVEKGVNQGFVLDRILLHPCLQYEPLSGFEDMYVKVVWAFFKKKTRSNNLAPTFVTWWKKGRLTDDSVHAKHLEQVVKLKRQLPPNEQTLRRLSKDKTAAEFREYYDNLPKNTPTQQTTTPPKKKTHPPAIIHIPTKKVFDIERFKAEHPKVYQDLYDNTLSGFKDSYQQMGQTFDENKFKKTILNNVKNKCKDWLKDNTK